MGHQFLSGQILLLQVFTAHHEIFIWGASRSTPRFGPVMNNTASKGDTISQTNWKLPSVLNPPAGRLSKSIKMISLLLFFNASFPLAHCAVWHESRSGLIMEPNPVTFISQSKAWCTVYQWQIQLRAAPSQHGGSLGALPNNTASAWVTLHCTANLSYNQGVSFIKTA